MKVQKNLKMKKKKKFISLPKKIMICLMNEKIFSGNSNAIHIKYPI